MNSFTHHTDEALFSLMKDDEERAFVALYDRYWERMFDRAYLLLNSREDAEEQVHDIFVKLWQKRRTIEIKYTLHTYLAAMLRYGCFKVLANRNRRIIKESTEGLEIVDVSTQQWLEFEALRGSLERAICKLPEKCQIIFRMSREEHLTDREIAERLDLSVNTVRTQMYRALRKLKTTLGSFFCL